jgi:glutaminase
MHEEAGDGVGGLHPSSVMAVELNDSRTMTPMVDAGAIATTSLVPGRTVDEAATLPLSRP